MNTNSIKYVIIQAGGIGSRMENFTKNKPKCLLPYKGKTILERLLDTFNDKKIIIICDYLKEILETYTKSILGRKDIYFISSDQKTTSSGLKKAFQLFDESEAFIYVWSDLIFQSFNNFEFNKNVAVCVTDCFECRYQVSDNQIIKENSKLNGILGLFAFNSQNSLINLDESASFVGCNLKKIDDIDYVKIDNVLEIGTKEKYIETIDKNSTCRFFNDVKIFDDYVEKKCINPFYNNLIQDEINWYKFLNNKINSIPQLIKENPLTISRINGSHIFSKNWEKYEKIKIIDSIINGLNQIHLLGNKKSVYEDMEEMYFNKTFNRVFSTKSIIPYYDSSEIKINGKICINPFHDLYIDLFQKQIRKLYTDEYNVIHGDCTFSNIIVNNYNSFFIDPRGSFGNSKIYGDKNYDWAKLYYSVNGNYDSINSKKFTVNTRPNHIELNIQSNGFEEFSNYLIEQSKISKDKMSLQHSLIWLSLTGYAKEDIDSVLYSFYKGIYEWNISLEV